MAGAVARGDGLWMTDFEAAQKAAAEKNLPILIDFSGSDWCGWCIRLDKEVFATSAFQAFAKENLVLVLADFPRKKLSAEQVARNEKLAKQYGVEGFPTVLLLDAKGDVKARTGYRPGGAEAYVEHLKGLLSVPQGKMK